MVVILIIDSGFFVYVAHRRRHRVCQTTLNCVLLLWCLLYYCFAFYNNILCLSFQFSFLHLPVYFFFFFCICMCGIWVYYYYYYLFIFYQFVFHDVMQNIIFHSTYTISSPYMERFFFDKACDSLHMKRVSDGRKKET